MPGPDLSIKNLVIGIALLAIFTFGYQPVVNYFFYGGGWPFVQIVFIVIYFAGVVSVRRSGIPTWGKWLLYLAPLAIAVLMAP
ncbi:MAG TPA: hypothetical protein VFE50_18510 [Cyclobacteriaceae bacterium]|nr:hypothetical protein [Cyclobacteriaceae bacterium]